MGKEIDYNIWGFYAGAFSFLAVAAFVCDVWSSGPAKHRWFETGLILLCVGLLMAIPGLVKHYKDR